MSIIASREAHAPVLQLGQIGGQGNTLQVPLRIDDSAIPSRIDSWLNELDSSHNTSVSTIEGVWTAWRQNDWLRLEAVLAQKEGTTMMYVPLLLSLLYHIDLLRC
jgi:hypothetical protein